MAAAESPAPATAAPRWGAAARAVVRAAQAVLHPGGPQLFDHLVQELAAAMDAACAFVAVFSDERRHELRTLAAVLDGKRLQNFSYAVEGSPCASVVGHDFRYVASGVAAEFPPGTLFGAKGMDAYAAFPLNDRDGTPLGLVVAMDRRPMADAALCETLLKIFAGRIVAEIERRRADEALRAAALAVSSARGETVFDELVRYLAAILHVEVAFIARYDEADPAALRMLSMYYDGQILRDIRYPLANTPCATVLGQSFRAYPQRLREQFPHDHDAELQGAESYAGHPLRDLQGRPLGIVAISSRQPLAHLERIESMLQIFAVRAAAEIEQLAARQALQRSEASYRTIFEATEDAVFIHDWDSGRVLDVNPKACETYGYSRDEMLTVTVADVSSGVPPYTAEQALQHLQQAKLGRCPPFEWHRRNKDGSLHWDEVRLKAVEIDGQRRILAFTREITEHKAALAELQAREEQYRAIFNASADALVLRSADFGIVDVNATYEAMSGFARADVLGVKTVLANPPEVMPTIRALHERALAGEPVALETQLVRRDGARYELELRGVPIRHRGQPHVLYIGRDITERKRAEQALRASEEQYRAIFNASADALILWNSRFQRVDVNPAYEKIYGRTRDEVVGRGYDEPQFSPEYARTRRELVRRALAGEACGAVLESRRKDGAHIVTEVNTIPFTHRGEPHVLAIARDITERREAEVQRETLERQLRQAQKMEAIGQLTGGIAHDFNNILTSVIGYLVLGLERAQTLGDATLQRQLGQAHLASQRARDLIAQMLAFARRQRGERRVVPLAPLVRQTLQLLRATLPATVAVDDAALADDGRSSESPAVAADAVQLEQVLFNLCINARDAIQGPGLIRVRLRETGSGWHCSSCRARVDEGRWVELGIADSGAGIEAEVLERIFEPFYTTKEVGRGSGMGLAMVHGIVHDHGGHIVVETTPGAGTVFRVLLPPAEQEAGITRKAAATGATAAAASKPLPASSVMVVDDETLVGDFMAELLGGWGLHVVLQRDPVQAAAWLEDPAHALDLLITDQTMPGMTGLALAQRAVAARPRLPVLLYTGNTAALDGDEARRHGFCGVLRKPVDADELRSALRHCLEARRADPA